MAHTVAQVDKMTPPNMLGQSRQHNRLLTVTTRRDRAVFGIDNKGGLKKVRLKMQQNCQDQKKIHVGHTSQH